MYVPYKKGTYINFRHRSAPDQTIIVDGQCGLITSSGHGQVIQWNNAKLVMTKFRVMLLDGLAVSQVTCIAI